jgi:Ca-activated chloride channel family protein
MGKPEGAPIPIPGRQNTFIKDESGNTVITKLDENALRQIASEGGGSFVRVSGGTPDLQAIIEGVESKETEEFGSKKFAEYEDQYQYPLVIGLILLLVDPVLTNRKGKIHKAIKEVTN